MKNQMYCPSGDKSHLFQDRKQFILHLMSCPILNEIIEQKGLQKSGLIYQVCPKNFHHLKIAPNQYDINQTYEQFCSCIESNNQDYSNLQGFIQFGNNNMNDLFKFIYQMDNIKAIENDQEKYLYKDFEHQRNLYVKEKSLKNSIQQNRVLYMSFCDSLYNQKIQFTFIKDHIGMKDFIKKHGKIDQQFDIISEDKVQLALKDLSLFMDHSKKSRVIMEIQITQKNSFRENFFTCVQYKSDILLLFRYDIFNNFTQQNKPLYLLKLENYEYIDHVQIQIEKMKILQSQVFSLKIEAMNYDQENISLKNKLSLEDEGNEFLNLKRQNNCSKYKQEYQENGDDEEEDNEDDDEDDEDFQERILVEMNLQDEKNSKAMKNYKQERILQENKKFQQTNGYSQRKYNQNQINSQGGQNLQDDYYFDGNQKENNYLGISYLKQNYNLQDNLKEKSKLAQNEITQQRDGLLELFEFEQMHNFQQIDQKHLDENSNIPKIKKVTIYKRPKKIINPSNSSNQQGQQQIINQNKQQLQIKVISSNKDSFINKQISECKQLRKAFDQEYQKYMKLVKCNQRIQKYKQILQNEVKSLNS